MNGPFNMHDQRVRVHNAMRDWKYHTLHELAAKTGDPEASVSARIRDFRKERYGGWAVDTYCVRHTFYYRLLPPCCRPEIRTPP